MGIDQYLIACMTTQGSWIYGLLFLVIFCETGLVVTPFLPGDSLLFVAGSLAGQAVTTLQADTLFYVLLLASCSGNQVNYYAGRLLGRKVLQGRDRWWCRQSYLQETHRFYERHGNMTLILARFVPIVRTFAPFVAGIAEMPVWRFSIYNIVSGVLWIGLLISAGYFLGQIDVVKTHLSLWIYGIIVVSVMPGIGMYVKNKYLPS